MTKPNIGDIRKLDGKYEFWNGEKWLFVPHFFEGIVPIEGDIATIDGVKYKRIEE